MSETFYIVHDWMVENLKLTGSRLAVYAIIYSFSQNGGWFQGTASYLCRRSGLTERGVRKALKSLRDDGYIEKKERSHNGHTYIDYRSLYPGTKFTHEQSSPMNKVPGVGEQSSGGWVNKVPPIINIDNKKIINNARARTRNRFHDFQQLENVDYDRIEAMLTGKISPSEEYPEKI